MKPYPTITSYKQAVDEPASYATLEGIEIFRKGRDLHFASGNFATVFKAEQQGKQHALKCFLSSREDREERYRAIARYLKGIDSPYFVSYKYLTNELWVDDAEYPVVWMEWVEGQTLGAYLKDLCAAQDTSKIRALGEKFKELALWLLDQELAHGDLKHDNILVKPTGDLVLVDYDGMYVPTLQGRTSAEVGGKGYQHPQRSGKDYHANLDDFSILVIYTTLLALEQDPSLLEKYEAGNNLIVAHADLENWASSGVCRDLRRLGLGLWADRLSEALQQQGIALPGLRSWLQGGEVDFKSYLRQVLKPEYYDQIMQPKYFKPEYASQLWLDVEVRAFEAAAAATAAAARVIVECPQPIPVENYNLPSWLTLTLPGNIRLELILVKAGTFMMGSPNNEKHTGDNEQPQHQVTLTRDYYMGKYPITQAQWEAVMGENPSRFKGPNRPVEQVSWDDIQVFLQKANGLLKDQPIFGVSTGARFLRHYLKLLKDQGILGLPTEAQWEYAARGGEKSKGYVYAGGNNLNKVAWYKENSGMKGHVVREKHPNELGLYDMSGNVWEWCADWFGEYAAEATTDPVGPSSGTRRVLRGGCWFNDPQYCRAAYRNFSDPGNRNGICGFRVVILPV